MSVGTRVGRGTAGEVAAPYVSNVPSEPTEAETHWIPAPPGPPGPPSTAFPRAEAEQSLDRADAFLLPVSNLGRIIGP